jgi:hypothetical protein
LLPAGSRRCREPLAEQPLVGFALKALGFCAASECISESWREEVVLIRAEARTQSCPEPRSEDTGFFTATIFPNPAVRARVEAQNHEQIAKQLGTKLLLSRHQVEILDKCQED